MKKKKKKHYEIPKGLQIQKQGYTDNRSYYYTHVYLIAVF